MADDTEILRKLALNDRGFVDTVLGMGHDTVDVSRLDQKTHALIRLAASLAVDARPSSYKSNIEVALAAGAQVDEIVGTLIAVAPVIGLARVVSDAPELALALGYDVEAALEAQGDGATCGVVCGRAPWSPSGTTDAARSAACVAREARGQGPHSSDRATVGARARGSVSGSIPLRGHVGTSAAPRSREVSVRD